MSHYMCGISKKLKFMPAVIDEIRQDSIISSVILFSGKHSLSDLIIKIGRRNLI